MTRTLIGFIALTFTLSAFFSCKSISDDPKATAKAFYEALDKKDFDEAAKYSSKESQSALDMLKSAEKMARQFGHRDDIDLTKEMKGKKIEFTEPVMDGENMARVTILANGKEQMPLILKKEESGWKVAFDKATLMNTERSHQEETTPADTYITDSVVNEIDKVHDTVGKVLNEAKKSLDSLKQ